MYYENNRTCCLCTRPFPANLMAKILDNEFICPQCGEAITERYISEKQLFDDGILDEIPILGNKLSGKDFNGAWIRSAVAAFESTLKADPKRAVRHDEYISLAAGMSIRLEQGDFDGDPKKCFEALWAFHAKNKFNRYIGLIADCGKELSYEELCEVLLLPRPDLNQIMELVNYLVEINSNYTD